MQHEDVPAWASDPCSPVAAGGWADFAAARARFLAACRRQAEVARLEALLAAPAYVGRSEPKPSGPEGSL
ncbi:MAG: hypothetical protein AB1416_07925 [Actinomycetota bacterium]